MSKQNGNGTKPLTVFATVAGTAIVSAVTAWGATNAGDAVTTSTRAHEIATEAKASAELVDEENELLRADLLKTRQTQDVLQKKIMLLNRNLDDLTEQLRLELTNGD